MSSKASIITISSGALLGTVLLVWQGLSVPHLSHDDCISYLAATANQERYAQSKPDNHWSTAGEWQNFWTPRQFGSFLTIRRDLAMRDIHPPLYFWVLHTAVHIFGSKVSLGPLMNVPIHLVTAALILIACRTLSCSPWYSAFAAVLWLLSTSTLPVAIDTRQYSLVGLLVAALLVAVLRFYKSPSRATATGIATISALGLLTHYHFLLVLAVMTALTLVHLGSRREWQAVRLLVISHLFSTIAFWALHPNFYYSFARQQQQTQSFSWVGASHRLHRTVTSMIELILPRDLAWSVVEQAFRFWPVAVLVFVTGTAMLVFASRRTDSQWLARAMSIDWLPVQCAALVSIMIGGLYVTFVSPEHAMSGRYLMIVSPILLVVLGQLFNTLGLRRHRLLLVSSALLVCWQAVIATHSRLEYIRSVGELPPGAPPAGKSNLLIDTVARGVIPMLLWDVDPDTPVYAASQSALINDMDDVTNRGRLLYLSDLRYENSVSSRDSILQKFVQHGFSVVQGGWQSRASGGTFELRRKALTDTTEAGR